MGQSFLVKAVINERIIIYNVGIRILDPVSITNFSNKDLFLELCRNGCQNYAKKWSCPPFAPSYAEYIDRWDYLTVFLFQVDMFQFFYIKNNYLKIKAANSILKSRADRFLRHLALQHGGYISTGSCRLCKPCKCKLELPCTHPKNMSFSFEAMGINVDALVQNHFNTQLLWYKQGCLPKYTSVVCGLLSNNSLCINFLKQQYNAFIGQQ
jgi:predicted metal-binding protein